MYGLRQRSFYVKETERWATSYHFTAMCGKEYGICQLWGTLADVLWFEVFVNVCQI